jgi:hypothetical protein
MSSYSKAKQIIIKGLSPLKIEFLQEASGSPLIFVAYDKNGKRLFESNSLPPSLCQNPKSVEMLVAMARKELIKQGFALDPWDVVISLERLACWSWMQRRNNEL